MNYDELSKENVLKKVTEIDIANFYNEEEIQLGKLVYSPFREETNPSFVFFISNNGNLLCKDWGMNERAYDIFEFVKRIFDCNYFDALNKINEDMELGLGPNSIKSTLTRVDKKRNNVSTIVKKELDFKKRSILPEDIKYWESYGIEIHQLSDYNIIPINNASLNGEVVVYHTKEYPLYALKTDNDTYKIYSPNKRFWMFNGKSTDLFCWDKLPKDGHKIIITKSLKDCIVLHNLNKTAIAVQSETIFLSKEKLDELQNRFKQIYLLFDNDNAGKESAEKIKSEYDFINLIFIPDYYVEKDISDVRKKYGMPITKSLINLLLK